MGANRPLFAEDKDVYGGDADLDRRALYRRRRALVVEGIEVELVAPETEAWAAAVEAISEALD